MAKYKIVGWYATNPTNEAVAPHSVTTEVEAHDRNKAFSLGYDKLQKLTNTKHLLNWYIEEIP